MTDTPIPNDLPPDNLSPSLGGQSTDLADAPALGGASRLAHLLEALEDSDSAVRARAADALGELGGEAAITRLMALMLDAQPDIRAQAARALGRARSAEAADLLIDALRDDHERVRWNAAEALGRIGHEGAVRHLLAATQDRDRVVRERAAEALGYLGSTLPAGALRDAIPPALLEMLRVASALVYPRLSQVVSSALLALRDAAVPALIAAAEQGDGRLSEIAAEVLGYVCAVSEGEEVRAEIVTVLLRGAAQREMFIARVAVRALAVPELVRNDDLGLARRVIVGLVALHSALDQPPHVETITLGAGVLQRAVMQMPPRSTSYIRPDLLRTLGNVAKEHVDLVPMVLPVLIDALYDEEADVRRASLEAIATIVVLMPKSVHGAVPALIDRLNDDVRRPFSPEPRISDAAAAVLRGIGTPEALNAVAKAGR